MQRDRWSRQVRIGELSTESLSRVQVFYDEKLLREQVQNGVHSSDNGEAESCRWRLRLCKNLSGDVWSDSSLEDEVK